MSEDVAQAPVRREKLTVAVREARLDDFPELSRVMARAFDEDPVTNWMAKQDGKRRLHIARLMNLATRRICFEKGICLTTDGLHGGSLWFPPGTWELGLTDQSRYLPFYLKSVGWRRIAQVLHGIQTVERFHPKEPHYYALAAGVDTQHQGKGIGTQLFTPMLERCDEERMPAYLESTNIRNNPLYERLGYKVTEEFDIPHGGPRVWMMWRDPQ